MSKYSDKIFKTAYGEGRYVVSCTVILCEQDLVVAITGGTCPHVGAVSLAVYEPQRNSATVSTSTVYTHRDDVLSAAISKRFASALQCNVTVTAGVHIDDPTDEELQLLQKNCSCCCTEMLEILRTRSV